MQRRSPGHAWLGSPARLPLSAVSVMSLLAALFVVAGGQSTTGAAPAAAAPCAPVLMVGVEGPREKRANGATFTVISTALDISRSTVRGALEKPT